MRVRGWASHRAWHGRLAATLLAFLAPLATAAQALWLDDQGRPNAAAREVVQWLVQAERDGLRPADYGAAGWARALEDTSLHTAATATRWDDLLTQTVTQYLHDLRHGRIEAARLGARYDSHSAPAPDLALLLRDSARHGQPGAARHAAVPPWPQYPLLVEALAQYRQLAGHAAWAQALPALPGRTLRPGQQWSGLPILAARLRALGDLPAELSDIPETYDVMLQDSVRAFQSRHGLEPDGMIGRATLDALTVPPAARVRQLELALERLRLTPLPAAARFITINVPEFMLRAWEHEGDETRERFAMRVIVGKALNTRTPLFDENMLWIEFSPYWNIPRSITLRETLPKLRANPNYLTTQGMEFVGPGGAISTHVTPELLAAVEAGQWRIRQRPGRLNALGDIKFVLPNNQAIYLHHTPSTDLFNRARRDFSHGCVRVEEPVALARWVLADTPDWPEARIRNSMGQARSITARLPAPVPVLVAYRTATVRDGRLHFAPDLYGQDALLEQALAQRRQQRALPP